MEGLSGEEKEYKKFFLMLPEEWEIPLKNWEEMIRKFQKYSIYEIPEKELTPMNSIMSEELFFMEEEEIVTCFKNARYCPPFLHRLEFIKIIYVRNGSVAVYWDEKKEILKSGNFCIVSPGVEHTVFSCHDEDCVVNIIMRKNAFVGVFSEILVEQNILSNFFLEAFSYKIM